MENKNNTGRGSKFQVKDNGRREVLKKAGKYATFTSASLFLVFSPNAQAQRSPSDNPSEWDW